MVVLVGPSAFFEDPVMAVLRALRRREVRSRRAEELPGVCASGCGSRWSLRQRLWEPELRIACGAAPMGRPPVARPARGPSQAGRVQASAEQARGAEQPRRGAARSLRQRLWEP